jgi:hypothetical protein
MKRFVIRVRENDSAEWKYVKRTGQRYKSFEVTNDLDNVRIYLRKCDASNSLNAWFSGYNPNEAARPYKQREVCEIKMAWVLA